MVRHHWDLISLLTSNTTRWLLSSEVSICCWAETLNISDQDYAGLGLYIHTTSAWLLHCLIVSILNGETTLRFEIGFHCPQQSPQAAFELWLGICLGWRPQRFRPRLSRFGSVQPYHCSLIVPMFHCEHTKWWDIIEIGFHCPEQSPQADFWTMNQPTPCPLPTPWRFWAQRIDRQHACRF